MNGESLLPLLYYYYFIVHLWTVAVCGSLRLGTAKNVNYELLTLEMNFMAEERVKNI